MYLVETIAKIRRYHFVDGKKIKEVCRNLGASQNTVRKALRSGANRAQIYTKYPAAAQIGNYVARVEELDLDNMTTAVDKVLPRKKRIFNRRFFNCAVTIW